MIQPSQGIISLIGFTLSDQWELFRIHKLHFILNLSSAGLTPAWWLAPLSTLSALLASLTLLAILRVRIPSQQPSMVEDQPSRHLIDPWMDRLLVATILISSITSLLSTIPGVERPSWLFLALQGFTYTSAALYYASLKED